MLYIKKIGIIRERFVLLSGGIVMFGTIGSGNKPINQTTANEVKKLESRVITENTSGTDYACDQVKAGNVQDTDYAQIGKLMAFAEANKKTDHTGTSIQEAVMEQTVDPSLLKSDEEAYRKGMEKYLYNTDRTWEDVYRPPKTDEKTSQAELDAWQKGMAEYRARWD